jgi:hypothetical protein
VIVTPEFTQALQKGDTLPIPVMPEKFLEPVKPPEHKQESRKQDKQEVKKAESEKSEPKLSDSRAAKAAKGYRGIPLLWKKKG